MCRDRETTLMDIPRVIYPSLFVWVDVASPDDGEVLDTAMLETRNTSTGIALRRLFDRALRRYADPDAVFRDAETEEKPRTIINEELETEDITDIVETEVNYYVWDPAAVVGALKMHLGAEPGLHVPFDRSRTTESGIVEKRYYKDEADHVVTKQDVIKQMIDELTAGPGAQIQQQL